MLNRQATYALVHEERLRGGEAWARMDGEGCPNDLHFLQRAWEPKNSIEAVLPFANMKVGGVATDALTRRFGSRFGACSVGFVAYTLKRPS